MMMNEQAASFGARTISEEVVSVDFAASPKKIVTAFGSYEARAVIVATGARPLSSALRTRTFCRVVACRIAPPATATSSAGATSSWSAAATPRQPTPSISRASATRSTSSIDATSCAPPRSTTGVWRILRTSSSCGTPRRSSFSPRTARCAACACTTRCPATCATSTARRCSWR